MQLIFCDSKFAISCGELPCTFQVCVEAIGSFYIFMEFHILGMPTVAVTAREKKRLINAV
ncbi:hypothetical protein D3C81_1790660 [compost metagenome]